MEKKLKETVRVFYMGTAQDFTEDDVKVLWDLSITWGEATKDDPNEMYLYKYPSSDALYIKYNGVKIPVSITMADFK